MNQSLLRTVFHNTLLKEREEGMRIRIRRCKKLPENILKFGELALDKAVNLSQETVLYE